MKKIFVILAAVSLAFSCNTGPAEKDIENKDVTEEKIPDSASTINDFLQFFDKFKADPEFQLKNVKFPYKTEVWELGADEPEVDKIYMEEWQHLHFRYDSTYATRKIDAYTQHIRSYGADTVKIELRGVDNGIAVDYEFVKLNGQWVLVAEKDYSG